MRNPFKAALQRGDKLIGLWLSMAQPYSAEICATAGFHWLLIDGEHAPNDVRSILAQLQAVAPHASHPVARAVSGDPALIKQLLDIGVQTLLVPMVDTPEQAAAMHRCIRAWLGEHLGAAGADRSILYGGSVKPDNAGALVAAGDIDGFLVGGASLEAPSLLAIVRATATSPIHRP